MQYEDELDPISSAVTLNGIDWRRLFEHVTPLEMAAYRQAYNRVLDRCGLTGQDRRHGHAQNALDAAALTL